MGSASLSIPAPLCRIATKAGWLQGPLFRRFLAGVLLFGCALCDIAAARAQGSDGAVAPAPGGWVGAAHVIVNPWVTIGLLVAGCLLLYHDLLTPLTWGTTGTLGVLCVGLVFAAHVTVGGVGWLGVVLMLFGLAAVLLEIHVFPGHGSALGGFILMFAGMFLSLGGTRNTAFALSVAACLTIVSGLAFLAYLPKSPAWQRIGRQLHRHAALTQNAADAPHHFVGHTGRTLTSLRPAGTAEIDGLRVPVVTEGEFLEANTAIVVTHLENGRVVVHMNDAASATTTIAA